jgi:hypothetical protein
MTACEELADGETVKPPFHEKRGPRPKVAAKERRKARHLPMKVPKNKDVAPTGAPSPSFI